MHEFNDTACTANVHNNFQGFPISSSRQNKVVNTTTSVAYRWAGALVQGRSLFGVNSHFVTDRPTDRRTNRVTYRVACTRLKTYEYLETLYLYWHLIVDTLIPDTC